MRIYSPVTGIMGAAIVALLALGGCVANPAPEPTAAERPLTTTEAQRLAIARFTNYDEKVRAVTAEVPGEQPLALTGWIDFADHRGYVAVTTKGGKPGSLGLFAWSGDTIAARDGVVDGPVLPPPTDGWASDALDPSASSLQNLFRVSLSLGSDRPDNPTLLQQSDARWLRHDKVAGVAVDVIAGPTSDNPASPTAPPADSPVRYWIDEHGRLLRVELRQPSSDRWTVLDLGAKADVDLTFVDALAPPRG